MFALLAYAWRSIWQKPQYSFILLGVQGAGKSNVLEAFKPILSPGTPMRKFQEIPSTIGLNLEKFDLPSKIVRFWDLGGESGLRPLWGDYIPDADAVVYVIDGSDTELFPESLATLSDVESNLEQIERTELRPVPLLILLNKNDKSHSVSIEDIEAQVKSWSRPVKVVSASAHTGSGLRDALEWLLDNVS